MQKIDAKKLENFLIFNNNEDLKKIIIKAVNIVMFEDSLENLNTNTHFFISYNFLKDLEFLIPVNNE